MLIQRDEWMMQAGSHHSCWVIRNLVGCTLISSDYSAMKATSATSEMKVHPRQLMEWAGEGALTQLCSKRNIKAVDKWRIRAHLLAHNIGRGSEVFNAGKGQYLCLDEACNFWLPHFFPLTSITQQKKRCFFFSGAT